MHSIKYVFNDYNDYFVSISKTEVQLSTARNHTIQDQEKAT